MAATLPDWADEDPPAGPSLPRRAAILALAALPWLVVLALVLTPRTDAAPPAPEVATAQPEPHGLVADEEDPSRPPPHPELTHPGGVGETLEPSPDMVAGWEVTELRGAWRVGPGDGETAALAIAVARAWLTGVPPVLPIDGLTPPRATTYAEHLAVEAIERPAAGAAVVTVLAIVLDTDGDGTLGDGRLERLAVPVVEGERGPRPGGAPWPLPGPDLSLAAPGTEEITDPALLQRAVEALHAAGYGEAALLSLGHGGGWPWVARFRSGEQDQPTTVWLRRHQDGFVVAGLPLHTALGARPDEPDDPDRAAATDGDDDPEVDR